MSALLVGAVLGQLADVTAGGYTATLSVADRAETRMYSSLDGGTAIDVETTPAAGLALTGRRSSFFLGYGQRLVYVDIEDDRDLTLMHAAQAGAEFWTRRLRLRIGADASVGRQSVEGLPEPIRIGAPPPAAGAPRPAYLPEARIVHSGSLRGSASAAYVLSRRWSSSLGATYGVAGGFDYFDQQAFPPSRGPSLDASLTYAATRRDQLATRIAASHVHVLTTGGNFLTVTATESWRHAWSPRTEGGIGAGVAYVLSQPTRADDFSSDVSGAGDASITYTRILRRSQSLAFRAAAGLGAFYNPVLAVVQSTLSTSLSSTWTSGRLSASASVDGATSVPPEAEDAARVVSGGVGVGYAPTDPVALEAGARAYTQLLPEGAGRDVPPQWAIYAAIRLAAPPIRF